jgi:hypothetical protein
VPIDAAKMSPANHHCLFNTLIDKYHDSLELITKFALYLFIFFGADVIIDKVFASFANERIELLLILAFIG